MSKKTPQDVFDAMHEALKKARPTVVQAFLGLPERWEDVSPEQQNLFLHMAWGMNLIAGEYMLDEKDDL
jgi:hypothetical protein